MEAGWLELRGRDLLRVRGGDRVRFLNGMLTVDVEALGADACLYGAQLDRKGHFVSDLWVLVRDREIWLDTAPGRGAAVREILEKHVIADAVEIETQSGWAQVAFEGDDAPRACGSPEPAPGTTSARDDLLWIDGGALTPGGVRLLGPAAAVHERVSSSGLPELPRERAEALRIESFLPAFGVDFGAKNFPAEARLEHAVSFSKGCYIGQEIVARIHARGSVNRLLVLLRTEGTLAAGDEVAADGRVVGEVTSATGGFAIALVKRGSARPDTSLSAGGTPATVTGPPLDP